MSVSEKDFLNEMSANETPAKYLNSSKKQPEKVMKGGRGLCCCVPECGSAYYNSKGEKSGISLFKFPTEKSMRSKWERWIKIYRRPGVGDNFKITDSTRVC